ncbi:MAG: hypothetical protein ACK504_02230 [Bacteroidota bacterium]|jgi:hypothetical protein
MLRSLILFFLLLNCFIYLAQTDYVVKPPRDYNLKPSKFSAFIEFGGNAGLFSLNADRIYYYRKDIKISSRIGFALHMNNIYMEPIILLENNFILFKNPHHLELGLGATIQRRFNEKENEPNLYAWENIFFSVWRCGYRFQKQDDGLFLRAALTPVIMRKDDVSFQSNYFQFWAGVSIGMSF